MKTDQQRIHDILLDTIRLLCRTGVKYSRRLRVQGLLGITVDDDHVFLISVDDCIARNCADVDAGSLCDSADDSSGSPVDGDIAASESRSENCNVEADGVTSDPSCVDAAVNHSDSLSPSPTNHVDVLTSVAMSEIATAASDGQDKSPAALQIVEDVFTAELPVSCRESCVDGGSSEPLAAEAVNMSSWTFTPTEPTLPNDNESRVEMETDTRCDNKVDQNVPSMHNEDNVICGTVATNENERTLLSTESRTMPPLISITNQHVCQLAAVANQSPQRQLANFDDFDSSIGDSNDDADSDRSTASEDIVDYVSVPHFNPLSSLQIDPRALAVGVSKWPPTVACRTASLSESGKLVDGISLPAGAAVLTGVHMPAATPQAPSAYYHQQMLAAAAAAAHNRAARAAAVSIKPMVGTTESSGVGPPLSWCEPKPNVSNLCSSSQRRLPRRPRESQDKRFRCPFCELTYYHKKHLKYHLTKKHGF